MLAVGSIHPPHPHPAPQIMSRQSNLSKGAAVTGPPSEQDIPLDIPKKSKLSIEQVCVAVRPPPCAHTADVALSQSEREKMNAKAMHQAFQQALCRLRLHTSRSFAQTLSNGFGPGKPAAFRAECSLPRDASAQ